MEENTQSGKRSAHVSGIGEEGLAELEKLGADESVECDAKLLALVAELDNGGVFGGGGGDNGGLSFAKQQSADFFL